MCALAADTPMRQLVTSPAACSTMSQAEVSF